MNEENLQEQTDTLLDSTFKEKKDLHIFRKLFHMTPGLFLIFLILKEVYPTYLIIVTLGLAFLLVSLFETIRIKYKKVNNLTMAISKPFIRKEEIKEYSGVPFYLAGCFICLLAFNKDIALLSIFYLALGDPFSSFMGILFGSDSHKFANGKSIVGLVSGIIICFMITVLYGTFIKDWDISYLYVVSIFGGLAGGLSECFVPDQINDNLFIPVVSALILSIVFSNFAVIPK